MQQTPAQTHTLDSLKQALVTHKPQLEPIIDTVFAKFTQPSTSPEEIAEQLKTMLQRDITPGESEAGRTFTWRNPSNQPIVLTIPLEDEADEAIDEPVDEPAEEATAETTSEPVEAQVEAAPTDDEANAPAEDAAEPQAAEATADEPDSSDEDGGDAGAPERERVNLLDELDTLLDNTNLHLIIQRTGKRDGQNVLSVTVVPQAKDDKTDPALLTPLNLKGTALELEAGLLQAIRITADGNRSIEEALAELEAAKKEAAAAKKAEASKAKKGGSKAPVKAAPAAAAKKEEEAKPATPSLFDAAPADTKTDAKADEAEGDDEDETEASDE